MQHSLLKYTTLPHTLTPPVPEEQIEFVLSQLWYHSQFQLSQTSNRVLKDEKADHLKRFLMDKCSSLHLALKMYCWWQAAVEGMYFMTYQ